MKGCWVPCTPYPPWGHPRSSSTRHGRRLGSAPPSGSLLRGRRPATWCGLSPAGCTRVAPPAPHHSQSFPPGLPAFKQSPPAIPALGSNVKKRRHGDEDMYYMHVSRPCPRSPGSQGGHPGATRGGRERPAAPREPRPQALRVAGPGRGSQVPESQAGQGQLPARAGPALTCGKARIPTGRGLRDPHVLGSGGPHPCRPSRRDSHMT